MVAAILGSAVAQRVSVTPEPARFGLKYKEVVMTVVVVAASGWKKCWKCSNYHDSLRCCPCGLPMQIAALGVSSPS